MSFEYFTIGTMEGGCPEYGWPADITFAETWSRSFKPAELVRLVLLETRILMTRPTVDKRLGQAIGKLSIDHHVLWTNAKGTAARLRAGGQNF